jgi:hypothetical protein
LQGALTAGLFFGVGELGLGAGSAANVAAHAAVGCASSAASGGRCGSGAMGAGFGEFAGPILPDLGRIGNTVTSAVLGGTGSVLGGGKFANGAVTGAYGYLFNCVAHQCNAADYDPRDPNYHSYGPFASPVTCNVSQGGCLEAARLEMSCNSAPGQAGCTGVGEEKGYNLRGNNPITQYRQSPDMLVNGTSPSHSLHDGYVVRWLSVDAAGDVRIWTAGIGVNSNYARSVVNQYGGAALFRAKGAENALNVRLKLGN